MIGRTGKVRKYYFLKLLFIITLIAVLPSLNLSAETVIAKHACLPLVKELKPFSYELKMADLVKAYRVHAENALVGAASLIGVEVLDIARQAALAELCLEKKFITIDNQEFNERVLATAFRKIELVAKDNLVYEMSRKKKMSASFDASYNDRAMMDQFLNIQEAKLARRYALKIESLCKKNKIAEATKVFFEIDAKYRESHFLTYPLIVSLAKQNNAIDIVRVIRSSESFNFRFRGHVATIVIHSNVKTLTQIASSISLTEDYPTFIELVVNELIFRGETEKANLFIDSLSLDPIKFKKLKKKIEKKEPQ